MTRTAKALANIPLVGRTAEVALLLGALDEAGAGRGRTLIVAGEGGVGKTRLMKAVIEQASQRGWTVAEGRSFPVESGIPYALFSDALLPTLRRLEAGALQTLSRGGGAELAYLFPALAAGGTSAADRERQVGRGDPAELKSRIFWNFTQFLSRFAAKQPLLVVLENLQWADASSLELLHFIARQIGHDRILLLCTYNDADRDAYVMLRTTEQSLISLGVAQQFHLEPLSRAGTEEFVHQAFGVDPSLTREFTALLYGWTRGNPFFVEETLKALVESERLRQENGTWLGWEIGELDLPKSIRVAVVDRMNRLGAPARTVANLTAVVGTRASYEALRAVSGLPDDQLLAALDELRGQRVLVEGSSVDGGIVYDFHHPILQETLYTELGLARARLLHGAVAESLETYYDAESASHADELAFHYARADVHALAPKAVKYLTAAGRNALGKSANREAANYLSAALEQTDRGIRPPEGTLGGSLVEDLARARQRLGEYDSARQLWSRARDEARAAGDLTRIAIIERRMGLACFWSGRHDEALAHYAAGLEAAKDGGGGGSDFAHARLQLAKGMCLLELGRRAEAVDEVQRALVIAERLADPALLARVHRALLLLYVWTGPADLAREHARRAIALAEEAGEKTVMWSAHWAMAMLEGLTGNAASIARHIAESERLADELRSPLLRVWIAEVSIEYASGIGDWDAALALGERSIAVARSLSQRTLLPRLLVWSGLIYLGRGDIERAKRYLDEAWDLSGAGNPGRRQTDVHSVVPAHTGMASYYLAIADYHKAIEIGEAGLAIADRTGYVVWAVHRLLPVIVEASLWLQDRARAELYGERLRRHAQQLDHPLARAWADACDALVAKLLDKDFDRAAVLLRKCADALDAIPFVDAARARRQLALTLVQTGDRDGAIKELRHIHDVFARIGAERELTATREQLRALGARPPTRTASAGMAGLTGREVDIVRLVAARKSNKEIGGKLGISPRTVSTHLSNIFGKLSVESRGELTDLVRQQGLPES